MKCPLLAIFYTCLNLPNLFDFVFNINAPPILMRSLTINNKDGIWLVVILLDIQIEEK